LATPFCSDSTGVPAANAAPSCRAASAVAPDFTHSSTSVGSGAAGTVSDKDRAAAGTAARPPSRSVNVRPRARNADSTRGRPTKCTGTPAAASRPPIQQPTEPAPITSTASAPSPARSSSEALSIGGIVRAPQRRAAILECPMSIKSDRWIRRMAEQHGMIEPFEPGQVRHAPDGHRIVSYGTSSYGYDIRCAPEFKVFTNIYSTVVDPKNFDERSFVDIEADVCIIPPNSFALARTLEYFRIPRNVLTICLGKSTYARCGIIVNVTPFEPEWEGYVTLEFSNTTPLPAKIYAGEGCAQVLFFESDEVCETSYKDRGGKYQGQRGVTLPKT
jgi:dCTP deaminase